MSGLERGMVEDGAGELTTCGYPGKQGRSSAVAVSQHGRVVPSTAGVGGQPGYVDNCSVSYDFGERQGQGCTRWTECCHLSSSSALGLVLVPCLPSFSESQLSSGSLQKIPSHIHLSFKQRSISSLCEKIIPQPRCPGNLCVEPRAFPF